MPRALASDSILPPSADSLEAKGWAAVTTDPDRYATLPLHRYRAVLRPRRDLMLVGERKGSVLRGTLDITLRQLVCHDLKLACARCRVRKSCAFPAVFDPGAAADAPVFKRYADAPQPFVVRLAQETMPERIPAGAELALDLHVVGAAQRQAPYLLAALARLADDGLGPTRVPLELERVDALDAQGAACAVAADGPQAIMRPSTAPALRAGDLAQHGDGAAAAVRVRFLTPTLLRQGGAAESTPASFGALIRQLHARLGSLASVFGDGPFGGDPRALAAAADAIEVHAADVHVPDVDRRSSRTGERHTSPRGLVGEACYAGDLGPFMPLLRLGELLHVGKHASVGLGRIQVETHADAMPHAD